MADRLELKVLFAAVDKFIRPANAIKEKAREVSKTLKEAEKNHKELNDRQKRIDGYRETNKALGINKQKLEEARSKVKQMAEEMAATAVPSIKMQRAFEHARQETANLSATVNRLTEKKQRLRQELAAVGINTKQLASAQTDLKGKINAATAAVQREGQALDAANKKMQRLKAAEVDLAKGRERAAKFRSVGASMMVGGGVMTAAAAVPAKAYATAEDSATQLKVAMMGKSGKVSDEFAQINELAERLGNRLPGTTSDFQDMMTTLVRQGMPAKSILGGLGEATAYLAVQMKMAPTEAAEFASKLQDATRTTDKDMMGLMDTIQKTYYLGVDSNNMLEGFAKLSPALSILRKEGLGASKALAPLLVMADQAGMKGEAAGNAFRKIFQGSLDVDKLEKGNKILEKSGVKLNFSDGKGEFGGLDKMYAQLAKLRKVNSEQRLAALKKIFGDDAETLQALSLLIEKGADGYKEVQAKMEAQAALQTRVNEQLGTLKNLWDAASGTFTNALVAFGESISPELKTLTEWIGNASEATQRWAKDHPSLSRAIMLTIGVTGLALSALGGLITAVGMVLAPMALLTFSMRTLGIEAAGAVAGSSRLASVMSVIARNAGLLARGIGWLAGRASLLLTVFTIAYTAGGYLNDGINALISKLAGYDTSLGAFIFDVKEKFKNAGWSEIGSWILKGIESGLDFMTAGLYSKMKNIAIGLKDQVKSTLGIHSPSRVFAQLGGYTMQGLEQGLTGGANGPINIVGRVAEKLAEVGAGLDFPTEGLYSKMKNIALGLKDQVTSKLGINPTFSVSALAPRTPMQGLEQRPSSDENGSIVDIGLTAERFAGPDASFDFPAASLYSKIRNIAISLKDRITSLLGINLPTSIFGTLGNNPIRGFENRLTNGADAPIAAMGNFSKRLASLGAGVVISSASMAGTTSHAAGMPTAADMATRSASGNTYHITIQAPTATDNQGLAALVAREIERIEAKKASSRRSRLRDMD